MLRRVVVTGLGVVAPTGIGWAEFWANVVAGRSGIDRITLLPGVERFPTQIAGEVKDFVPERFMDRKDARRMDRFAQLAVAASRLALEDAGLDLDKTDRDRVGVLIGSGIGGIRTLEQELRVLVEKGPDRVSPFLVPM
ncbi:MAG: beta-ketoacyl synthase N-terminal-like domain-containing protein, partial [Bacillota bacterium]|nr:beta-ketoacyl synthase N-terminal-like domain-containing protein [Bacillota bacterium]